MMRTTAEEHQPTKPAATASGSHPEGSTLTSPACEEERRAITALVRQSESVTAARSGDAAEE
jgi:hypothetical protein